MNDADKQQRPRPRIVSLIGSLVAAAFGVQSSRNRERDFQHGNASHYIVGGIVFAGVFVVAVWLAVRLVLSQVS